ncbi:uncharacterized protein F5891DRAFT_1084862 [Suillus fuscotomentosus]|uniref:Uncharacterized protein n=1 Tax=Suillus fuscotomentosus TaxID=1912939 RepID=A0AAD4DNC5_9AGAM|nr:uncharacterized protein F5891DRAFT_1084862 [Suillus fuscotomentosus]KAG1885935.1 hypothetical protein F5891DRAFT_1084862 [Suillus fuscotomentosus]
MPPPTKRQKQAKQQYASSSRCFDNGLIEDVFEVFLDPDYVPVSDAESEADSESDFNGALSFSLIDGNIGEVSDNESELDDEAAMEIVVKAEETVDYAEGCARRAAVSAQKFWANIMSSVSNINQCTDIHRKFDQDVFSGDTKPVKLPKRSMPTYKGAKNNMTITSFWARRLITESAVRCRIPK